MEEGLRKILVGKCHNDLATDEAVKQVSELFNEKVLKNYTSWIFTELTGKNISELDLDCLIDDYNKE